MESSELNHYIYGSRFFHMIAKKIKGEIIFSTNDASPNAKKELIWTPGSYHM
jgi:hypothetical protein